MQRLKDRAALITGGAAGIGKAQALRFAQEGARIVVELPEGNARPPGGLVLKLPGRDEMRIERLPARLEVDAR